jgi:inorganic phosphate transporter, PiT family
MLIIIVTALVAYANGANANFKGVASLYGSHTTTYRTAQRWAALTTLLGALASTYFSSHLLKAFSGKGLVPDELLSDPMFLLSVALGAMLTGSLATWFGFPVSTTHALTGGLLGAGFAANASQINWFKLWSTFLQPLLIGPIVAILLGATLYAAKQRSMLASDSRSKTVDALHFLSAGAVGFARGMNDTPKIAALLGVTSWLHGTTGMLLVAVAMMAGGLISSRSVAETLAHNITDMNSGQAFVANLSTAILVILGSVNGLPLSTTHVSVGALLGIGITTHQAHWRTVRPVVIAWIITLPCAAMLAAASLVISKALGF